MFVRDIGTNKCRTASSEARWFYKTTLRFQMPGISTISGHLEAAMSACQFQIPQVHVGHLTGIRVACMEKDAVP